MSRSPSFNPEFARNTEVDTLEIAKEAIRVARISPDTFRGGEEQDPSLRHAIELTSKDSKTRYADLGVSAEEVEALFGIEVRLRFDEKELHEDIKKAA